MKAFEISQIRNLAIVAGGGAGKTSVAEAILYDTKTTDRLGKVLEGSSILDFEPEEVSRHITISSALGYCEWKKHKINFIDTPGYANFIAETQAALRVVDSVLMVISSVDGIKVLTEKIWQRADEYQLPKLVFINKLDQERANFLQTLEELKRVFKEQTILPVQIPLGEGESFKGLVDLLEMKAFVYERGDSNGIFKEEAIPADLQEKVVSWKETLVETVAESNDELLEKYLEGEELTLEEIKQGLRKAVCAGKVVPVLGGSATQNIGIQPLLDFIVSALPAPSERPEVVGKNPQSTQLEIRKPSKSDPFSALVFKTFADPFAGRLSFFKVYSGELKSDSTILNATRGEKERIGQIYAILGKNQKPVSNIPAGDFGVVAKLKATQTGDTLTDEKAPIIFDPIKLPEPVISFAIVPKSKGDEEKVSGALSRMLEEDPTLRVTRDPQTKEMILSGMGEVHLEVILERLKRKFGLEVEKRTPKIPYKETIRGTAKVQGKYKRQSGGRGQYGDTWLEIEPLPRGKGFEFVDKIVGGVIPKQYIPAVEKGILEAMNEGVLAGYPVVDVKVTLYDGSYHEVDSSDMAFKIAASMGFKKGVEQASPVLLEPIVSMEITIPEEYLGDVIGDLNARRGRVQGVEPGINYQTIRAQVPLAEVLAYATALRSMTGDRGVFSMEFSHYEEVPPHLSEKIIAQTIQEKQGKQTEK
jgi:elongation factor G